MVINTVFGRVALVLIYHVGFTLAKYCSVRTEYGYEYKYCPETCCQGFDARFDVCCGYQNYNTAYIGGSLGALISIAVVILCVMYICCKKRIRASQMQNTRRSRNTRLHTNSQQRNNVIPSVSLSIQPTLPPPYDNLPPPPPYYPSDSMVGGSGKDSDKTQYPDHPPPEYTETVNSNPST